MRSIAAVFVCTLMLLGGSVAQDSKALKLVQFYGQTTLLPETKKRECIELLWKEVAKLQAITAQSLTPVDALMHQRGCLDKYSGLDEAVKRSSSRSRTGVRMMMVDGIVYMRLESFSEGTRALFDRAYAALPASSVKRANTVVIDLRQNLGGDVEEMRDILHEYFIPHASFVYMRTTISRAGVQAQIGTKRGVLADKDFVILVDRNTASAAEWIAAVIRYEMYATRTVIVGERTYGKALIQCLPVDDTLNIKVTCDEWEVNGKKVQGIGLEPDLAIPPFCRDDPACIIGRLFELAKD